MQEPNVGDQFGKLTVLTLGLNKSGRKACLCLCECGSSKIIRYSHLTSGGCKSCGCSQGGGRRTHGYAYSKTYKTWLSMKSRCTNANDPDFMHYGGRGIKIDCRWKKFENFLEDMGDRPAGKELDRIIVDGHYFKDNCRWVSHKTNMQNLRGMNFALVIRDLTKEQLDGVLRYIKEYE